MKIAICVPTTTRFTNITDAYESHLNQLLLKSSCQWDIKYFVGYDHDDPLWSKKEERDKLSCALEMEWLEQHEEKGHVSKIWNNLAEEAIAQGFEYLYCCGDDIYLDKQPFITDWIGLLKKQNNIGYVAPYSGNDMIPTQFFFHRTHYDIFSFIFPPQIKNWFIDNFIYMVYGKKYGIWKKEYQHLNVGGQPRYEVKDACRLCDALVRRYKRVLNDFINKNVD